MGDDKRFSVAPAKVITIDPVVREKLLKHRNEVLKELVQTETRYVEDLNTIVDVFVVPLKSSKQNIISPKDVYTIFSNIQLLLNVNKELLKDLSKIIETPGESQIVGDIFLKLADYLKMYNQYCGNQGKALNIVEELKKNKPFALFLDESMVDPRCRNEPLNSFLIKPIQRICRYPLLLKEMLKHTPEDHADFESLTAALAKVTEVVQEVNESQRKGENIQKILEIQNFMEQSPEQATLKLLEPGRRYLQEVTFLKMPAGKQRRFFMFNDIVIYGRPSVAKKNGFLLRGVIFYEKAKFNDIGGNLIEIERLDTGKVIQVKAEKIEEKTLWLKNLQDLWETMEKRKKEKESVTTKLQLLDPVELLARKEDEINEFSKKLSQIVASDEKLFVDLHSLIEKNLETYKKRQEALQQLQTLQEERLILLAYQSDESAVQADKTKRTREKKQEKKKEQDRRALQEERKRELEEVDDSDQLKIIKLPPLTGPNLWNKPFVEQFYNSFSALKLLSAHFQSYTHTPEIVLVGEQGCGKSAVLEALVGIPFNYTGKERTGNTKRPLFLQLVNNPKCDEIRMFFKKDPTLDLEDTPVTRQQIAEEISKRGQNPSSAPISLIFEYKYFWDVTFIDTPGLPPKPESETADPDKTDKTLLKTITKLIKPPHRLILALESSKDWNTSDLSDFIKKIDPTYSRSIFVYTKFHLLTPFLGDYEALNQLANICPGDPRNCYFVSLFSRKIRQRIASSDEFQEKIRRADQRDLNRLKELRYDKGIGYNCGIQSLLSRVMDESWQQHRDNVPRTTEIITTRLKTYKEKYEALCNELNEAKKQLKQTRILRVGRLREICSEYVDKFFLTFHQIIEGSFPLHGEVGTIWQGLHGSSREESGVWNTPLWDRRLYTGGAQLQSLTSSFRNIADQLEIKLSMDEVRMITVYMKQTNDIVVRASDLAQQKFKQLFEPIIEELIFRGVHIIKQIIELIDYALRGKDNHRQKLNTSLHLCLTVKDMFLTILNEKAQLCRDKCLRELRCPHLIYWELSASDRELFTFIKRQDNDESSSDNLPNFGDPKGLEIPKKEVQTKRLSQSLRTQDVIRQSTEDLPLSKRVIHRDNTETLHREAPILRNRESSLAYGLKESTGVSGSRDQLSSDGGSQNDPEDDLSMPDQEEGNVQGENIVVNLASELFIEIRKRLARNVLLKFHEFFLLPMIGRKALLISQVENMFAELSDEQIEQLFEVELYFKELKAEVAQVEKQIAYCSEQEASLVAAAHEIANYTIIPISA